MKRRYPLDAVVGLRKHETALRTRDKANRTAERRAADRRLAQASEQSERERTLLGSELSAEREHLQAGALRASDLAQSVRFKSAAERRIFEKETAVVQARQGRQAAVRKELAAERALGEAHRAEKSIAEHRARHQAAERRHAERSQDASAEDAWHSRFGRRRGDS